MGNLGKLLRNKSKMATGGNVEKTKGSIITLFRLIWGQRIHFWRYFCDIFVTRYLLSRPSSSAQTLPSLWQVIHTHRSIPSYGTCGSKWMKVGWLSILWNEKQLIIKSLVNSLTLEVLFSGDLVAIMYPCIINLIVDHKPGYHLLQWRYSSQWHTHKSSSKSLPLSYSRSSS